MHIQVGNLIVYIYSDILDLLNVDPMYGAPEWSSLEPEGQHSALWNLLVQLGPFFTQGLSIPAIAL